MYIQKTFEQTGNYDLFGEFVETLVNDDSVPSKLCRQIWTLASTTDDGYEQRCADIVASFQDSGDESDLTTRWRSIVDRYWSGLVDCPLKREIDEIPEHVYFIQLQTIGGSWTDLYPDLHPRCDEASAVRWLNDERRKFPASDLRLVRITEEVVRA